jgi:uncharacterized protein (TIGR03067 family)
MRALIVTALLGATLTVSATAKQPVIPDRPPPDKTKASELEGSYTIVSGEREGTAIPAEELKDGVFRLAFGKLVAVDQDRREFLVAKYTVDTAKTPWKIEMKSELPTKASTQGDAPKEQVTSVGLIKKDGATVTLIYAMPGGEAPTGFKTKAKQQMFVLKSFAAEPPIPDNKFKKGP